MWKHWGDIGLLIHGKDNEPFTDLFPQFLWDTFDDKAIARELKVMYEAISDVFTKEENIANGFFKFCDNRLSIAYACEALHKKYWHRFVKNIFPIKVKKHHGYIPHMQKTQAMKEFLAMGFMHISDLTSGSLDMNNYSFVYAHVGDLWWPERFDSQLDAIKVQKRLGIPGLTGTTLIKSK